MPVITVSRLTGSGGAVIGQKLAERLQANFLNTQIIQAVAHRLDMSETSAAAYDERADAFIERLGRVLWFANPSLAPAAGAAAALPLESTSETFVAITRQLVQEAARTGNVVIFGHGAQFILADQPNVLNVRFVAPLPVRVERVMRRAGMPRAAAERHVRQEDQRRTHYIRQFYHADWYAPDPFHLILNTARWAEEACVRLILDAVREHERGSRP